MTACDLSEPSWTSNHWGNRALNASPSWKLFPGLNSSCLFLPSDCQVLLTVPRHIHQGSCVLHLQGSRCLRVLLKILLKGKHQIKQFPLCFLCLLVINAPSLLPSLILTSKFQDLLSPSDMLPSYFVPTSVFS